MRNRLVRARTLLVAALLSLALVAGATATVVADGGATALDGAVGRAGPEDQVGMPWPK